MIDGAANRLVPSGEDRITRTCVAPSSWAMS
eukprot:CAMPEP_0201241068 /NCGR_PEP_ID=MMETSP0852-20130820/32282_1 /ASSEMBLY_ACC=CAM_ASM_000632 /TAXON_ID=183588 /ORGANISM="Pseudo-nitzschia fraudulenta, Strain WWA7" /LENGTH=30 /DNA_ID= /DNA_START= /DNA_END= /DNA_ORIENTATION=